MKLKLKWIKLLIVAAFAALTKRILGSHAYAVIVNSENGLLAVDPEDFGVGKKLRVTGKYGSTELERLRPHITSDCKVLIVGAHVGALAIPISKLCKSVIAIEANPATCDLLKTNILLNSISNCKVLNIAANDKSENISFLMNRVNSGSSKRVPQGRKLIYYFDNPERITINAVSLDEYLEENNFHIVLMDIEGSEYLALKGMQEILSNCKLLVVEYLPHHLKNVSGVTVAQFLSVISPHFSKLTIPSKQLEIRTPEFCHHLTEMYKRDKGDKSLVFEKI